MKKLLKLLALLGVLLVLALLYFYFSYRPAENPSFALNFSTKYAQYLGFDWRTVYLDVLNDLQPKKLRLMAYWDLIEPQRRVYDFLTIDEMLAEAGKRKIGVILVVGRKQPRWPECHQPGWYNGLGMEDREAALLEMLKNAVNHFKQFEAVEVWQVENEPLFDFGPACPVESKDLLRKEIELVRSLDSRPIMLTDSGELGRWLPTAGMGADLFGSTMYRVVHNPKIGYFKYPLPPAFFKVKAGLLKKFTGLDVTGVELQAEPWFADPIYQTGLRDQLSLMNPKIFDEYLAYARKAGFADNYLWGVEWWYWLAQTQGDWGMWERARKLLNQ